MLTRLGRKEPIAGTCILMDGQGCGDAGPVILVSQKDVNAHIGV
jgi:hypothetical protein